MAAETQASDKQVGIVSTALRDTLQSSFRFAVPGWYLYATAPDINSLGLDSIETFGGGALDQGMIRAGNDGAAINIEDAWLTSVVYRLLMPDTQSEALIRGGALNGYRQYPEDVQRAFVKEIVRPLTNDDLKRAILEVEKRRPIIEELQPGACDNPLQALSEVNLDDKPQRRRIEMLRVFSGSNDLDDMRTVIEAAKEEGAKVQAEISYARDKIGTPEDYKIFTTEYYVDKALRMVEMGADRIGIKDFAGLLTAEATTELVSALREALPDNIDIVVHSHDNAHALHNATDVYDAAVKNGATVVHASHGAMFKVGGHVGMEKLQEKWQGTEYDPKLDSDTLELINDYLGKVRKKFPHLDTGQADKLDERVLRSGAPGGGYYAAITQLIQIADSNYERDETFWKARYPDKNTFREATLNKYFETLEGVRSSMGEVAMVTPFYKFADDQARLLVTKLIYSKSADWAALEPDNPATWHEITDDVRKVMLGKQGQMPGAVNPGLRYRVQSDAIKAEANKQGAEVNDNLIAMTISDGERINDEYRITKALRDAEQRIEIIGKQAEAKLELQEFFAGRLAQAQEELQKADTAFKEKAAELGREPISHEDYVRLLTSDNPEQAYLRASMVQLCKQADVLPPAMDKATAEIDALINDGVAIPHRGEAIITAALCDGQSVPLYPKMTKTEVHLRRLYDPNWVELLTPAQIKRLDGLLKDPAANNLQVPLDANIHQYVPTLAKTRGTDSYYTELARIAPECAVLSNRNKEPNSPVSPNQLDDEVIKMLAQLTLAVDQYRRIEEIVSNPALHKLHKPLGANLHQHVPTLAKAMETDGYFTVLTQILPEITHNQTANSPTGFNQLDDEAVRTVAQLTLAVDQHIRIAARARGEDGRPLAKNTSTINPTSNGNAATFSPPAVIIPDDTTLDELRQALLQVANEPKDKAKEQAAVQVIMKQFGIPQTNAVLICTEIDRLRNGDAISSQDVSWLYQPLPKQTALRVIDKGKLTQALQRIGQETAEQSPARQEAVSNVMQEFAIPDANVTQVSFAIKGLQGNSKYEPDFDLLYKQTAALVAETSQQTSRAA